ncbi:MAG TPA: ABC transporter ATP-binding protein [Pirellulaceae bacterium]|nr:ABC transporter ATP-binding protein [Pirellulaceae bacterium]
MSQLVIRELVKDFPAPEGALRVLDGITLELASGDALAVIGPSGCGKSTLLHVAGTLDHPTSGSVELNGQNPFALSASALARFRNEQLGFVFQEHFLLPQLTALENVMIPVLAQRRVTPADVELAKQLLEQVGLGARARHRPGELSGGERQRVAVARALVCQPAMLLADEPTGSLDEKSAEMVGQLLLEVSQRWGTILICVTHSDRLAQRFSQRARLTGGKLVALD